MFLVDFSRRRQRKISTARPRGPPPKGFVPRSPIGTSNQKRGQKNTGVKGDSFTPTASEISGDDKKTLDVNVVAEEEAAVLLSQEKKYEVDRTDEAAGEDGEFSSLHDTLDVSKSHQGGENGKISIIEEVLLKPQKEETSEIRDLGIEDLERGPLNYKELDETIKGTNIDTDDKMSEEASQHLKLDLEETLRKQEEASQQLKLEMEPNRRKQEEEASRLLMSEVEEIEENLSKQEEASRLLKLEMEENLHKQEEASRLLKLEMEADLRKQEEASQRLKLEMEANLRRQEIERIADENFSQGNKVFVYPSVVKPDQDVEVFYNRSLSTLSNEPDVLIMGAFNDWRWKAFKVKLNKTHLKGDWWSCHLKVPGEAYKVDFVFSNGQSVYDNNDRKDFSIPVDGGMDASAFEDFLLEKKRKELEELAKEQAERERQAKEQRKMEEEKAAKEADREQARMETSRSQEMIQQLIKKAVRSMHNVWYIEPSEFNGKDLVKLYYNRSSGPLSQAKEVWIHGGHNNWKDGISFLEKLVHSGSENGDWWHAEGMQV